MLSHRALVFRILSVLSLVCVACGPSTPRPAQQEEPKIKIGLLMDTLQKDERWQRDRDLFVERAKELDAEVMVEAAERDDAKQLQQAESLLERGAQALVVVRTTPRRRERSSKPPRRNR